MSLEAVAPAINGSHPRADAANQQSRAIVSCSHCGLPVPSGAIREGATTQFCCVGCSTVYDAIHRFGLERYYCMQAAAPGEVSQARPSGRKYRELDHPDFLSTYTARLGPGVRSIEFFLEGVHCSACVWLVEKLPRVAAGVIEARLNLGRSLVKVVWDEGQIQLSQVAQALDSLGYSPHVGRDLKSRELRQRENRSLLVKIAIAGAGAGNVMLLAFALYGGSFHGMEAEYSSLFRWASWAIGMVVLLGPARLFFRGALAAIRTRTAHLDLPIAIGLGAGTVAGTLNTVTNRGEIYFDSLTGLVFLLLVGRYLQRRLEQRASDTVERLFSLTPSFAHLREGETTRDVPIETLELGQTVSVHAGECFPADGSVVEGQSTVDLSLLTGETRPIAVRAEDPVFAGALNVERPLLVRVAALGRDTRVGKLLTLMRECASRKAPIVQLADRYAGIFTIVGLVLFVATFLGWQLVEPKIALDRAVTLLIVNCPCGLGLATPFVVSVALGRAARNSILIKGGEVLELLAFGPTKKPTIFLDKTGTLTEPGLGVVHWHAAGTPDAAVLRGVAALEANVNHPIARALASEVNLTAQIGAPNVVLGQMRHDGIEGMVDGRRYHVGSGKFVESSVGPANDDRSSIAQPDWVTNAAREIAERGHTPVWVAVDGSVVTIAEVGSPIRSDAPETIASLRRLGLAVAILSGDDPQSVAAAAKRLGVAAADAFGGLSPEDKLQIVQSAKQRGPVYMVGDGVNDAAALSAATVGVAVRGGAEVSLAAADAYLGRAGVGVLVELFDGAFRTMTVIRRCLAVSLAYNVLAAALAISGSINALGAAILMPIASFTVLAIAIASATFRVSTSLSRQT